MLRSLVMETKTAVLLIVFNRPELALNVLAAIRKYRPSRLYIACDGARKDVEGESQVVLKTRESVLSAIDWECDVKTLFQEQNLGCGLGPSTAISWLFSSEEKGIILEDDCIPQLPFFDYCHRLLDKYEDNQRVWMISGRSIYQGKRFFKNSDYIFSFFPHTWGWATWRRAWSKFDITMSEWPGFYKQGGYKNLLFFKPSALFYNWHYNALYKRGNFQSHIWDYQFCLTIAANGGLGIVPSKNLVENVGYDGVHYSGITWLQKCKSVSDYEIRREPSVVLPDRNYERYSFCVLVYGKILNVVTRFFRKIAAKLMPQKAPVGSLNE